jgi:hypothetical protein
MSNESEINHSADLLIYELLNFQRDFEIPDEDMIPILRRVMQIVQAPDDLASTQTPLPVGQSLN